MASPLPGHTAALPAAARVAVCRQLETWVKKELLVYQDCKAASLPA